MASVDNEVAEDYFPLVRIYKDGRIERLKGTAIVPPSLDSESDVLSKDVVYSPETNLSSRLYLPKLIAGTNQKLPLLVYFHGGGFLIETAFSPTYHNYLNSFVSQVDVVVVSVDYRRAPEHPLPIAFDDCWTALKWVSSHVHGNGPEEWLNSHADLGKVFFAGDSAGATIAHQMAMRYGEEKPVGFYLLGIILVHPYFMGEEPVGDEVKITAFREKVGRYWRLAHPTSSGCDDLLINPAADPNLAKLGCSKVLVTVAQKDMLKYRGWYYYENLKKSGWSGEVEIMEAEEEEHVFHLNKLSCENSAAMLQKIASFMNVHPKSS
ncbi:hypothetical protein K2173_001166 [Erythroxylum novogranatense]|uniref:Alpha/beta hydrolase fold-3 domain-containing protein n=1 Tax=Erythroxylum novogranatense TaxID=1862640 RepID=A0AAV8TIB6_9ROSI|nr:hypothetical protein K2173_001166 [Erythroxylum novogranatense]